MKCDKCGSNRVLSIGGHCSDTFSMSYGSKNGHGYVPKNLFFGKDGYGDNIDIAFCLDCGKVQGGFPIPDSHIETALEKLESE